nr:hypothetical protein [Tanacetum cinerariifolium]
MADRNPCERGRGRGLITRQSARSMRAGHFNDRIDARDPCDIEIECLQQRDSLADETLSNLCVWNNGHEEFNPLGRRHQGHRDRKFCDDPL